MDSDRTLVGCVNTLKMLQQALPGANVCGSGRGCCIFVAETEKWENVKAKNESGGREEAVGCEPS